MRDYATQTRRRAKLIRAAEIEALAARLDDLMAQQAVNQACLARRMETNSGTVARLLQGSDAKISTLIAAAAALDCELMILPKVLRLSIPINTIVDIHR